MNARITDITASVTHPHLKVETMTMLRISFAKTDGVVSSVATIFVRGGPHLVVLNAALARSLHLLTY